MLQRVAAVTATRARFAGQPFAWGRVDCAKVVAFHLRQMGHHVRLGLAKAGTYRSALSARRALERAGHASLSAALDAAGFERIAPAAARPGDLIAQNGTDGFDAVGIVSGGRQVLGFLDGDVGLVIFPLANWGVDISRAWRL